MFGCMIGGIVYEICNLIVVMWLKVENVLVFVEFFSLVVLKVILV